MNLHQLFALVAAGALAATATWFTQLQWIDTEIGPPSSAKRLISGDFAVQLDPLEALGYYSGTGADSWVHLNPFIPGKEREKRARDLIEETKPKPVPKPPEIQNEIKRRPPIQIEKPKKPDPGRKSLDYPPLPIVYGMVSRRNNASYLVGLDDGTPARSLAMGESLGIWELVGIEGVVATFKDSSGYEHIVSIGPDPDSVTVLNPELLGAVTGGSVPQRPQGMRDVPAGINVPKAPSGGGGGAKKQRLPSADEVDLNDPAVQSFLNANPQLKAMVQANPNMALMMYKQWLKNKK